MVTCPLCGYENPEKFRFCGECHAKLPRVYNPDAADVGEDAVAYTMTDTATDTPSTETLSDLCSPAPDSSALNDDSLSTYKYALESSRENALPGSLLWRTMIGITTVIILILFTLYVLNAPGKHTASVKTGPAATESSKPSAVAGEDNLPDAVSEPDIKNDDTDLPASHNADISPPTTEGGQGASAEKPASMSRPAQSGPVTLSRQPASQTVTKKPERRSSDGPAHAPDKNVSQRKTEKKRPASAPATKRSQSPPSAGRPVGMPPPAPPASSDNERRIIEMEKPLASKTPIVIPHGD